MNEPKIRIRFAGSGPHLEFVEIENVAGRSIRCGTWETALPNRDGYHILEITASDIANVSGPIIREVHDEKGDITRTHHSREPFVGMRSREVVMGNHVVLAERAERILEVVKRAMKLVRTSASFQREAETLVNDLSSIQLMASQIHDIATAKGGPS